MSFLFWRATRNPSPPRNKKKKRSFEELFMKNFVAKVRNMLQLFVDEQKYLISYYEDTWLPQRKSTLSVLAESDAIFKKRNSSRKLIDHIETGTIFLNIGLLIFMFYMSNVSLVSIICMVLTAEGCIWNLSRRLSRSNHNKKVLLSLLEGDMKQTTKLGRLWNEHKETYHSQLKKQVDSFITDCRCNSRDPSIDLRSLQQFMDAVRLLSLIRINDAKIFFNDFLDFLDQVYASNARGSSNGKPLISGSQHKIARESVSELLKGLNWCYSKITVTDITDVVLEMVCANESEFVAKMNQIKESLVEEMNSVDIVINGDG